MATKVKKNDTYDWDHFGSDDRATDAKSRGISASPPPKKGVKKPTAKPKKK